MNETFETHQAHEAPRSQEEINQAWQDYVDGMLGPEYAVQQEEPVPQAVDAELQNELQTLRDERYDADVMQLVEDYPALDDPQFAQQVVEATRQRAHQMGQPERWNDPELVRQIVEEAGGEAAFGRGRLVAKEILHAAGGGAGEFRWW